MMPISFQYRIIVLYPLSTVRYLQLVWVLDLKKYNKKYFFLFFICEFSVCRASVLFFFSLFSFFVSIQGSLAP